MTTERKNAMKKKSGTIMKKVAVELDRPSHLYRLDEEAEFTFKGSGRYRIEFSLDCEKILSDRKYTLKAACPLKIRQSAKEPCFVRCRVYPIADGKKIAGEAGAGFEPENILPALPEPEDFDDFWRSNFVRLKKIPADIRCERIPELSDKPADGYSDRRCDIYNVSAATVGGGRTYGFLALPKGRKNVPLLVHVSGSGSPQVASQCRSMFLYGTYDDSEYEADFPLYWKRPAVLLIRVSGFPPETTKEAEAARFRKYVGSLNPDFLKNLGSVNYYTDGHDDPKNSLLARTILGGRRLIKWAAARPEIDPERVIYRGGSQGGDFGIYFSAFDTDIKAAFCGVPGIGDQGGFLIGRHNTEDSVPEIRTYKEFFRYFDGVNFAKRITCPVVMTVGFIDHYCWPSSVYPIFQALRGEKILLASPSCGHGASLVTAPVSSAWLNNKLGF